MLGTPMVMQHLGMNGFAQGAGSFAQPAEIVANSVIVASPVSTAGFDRVHSSPVTLANIFKGKARNVGMSPLWRSIPLSLATSACNQSDINFVTSVGIGFGALLFLVTPFFLIKMAIEKEKARFSTAIQEALIEMIERKSVELLLKRVGEIKKHKPGSLQEEIFSEILLRNVHIVFGSDSPLTRDQALEILSACPPEVAQSVSQVIGGKFA